MGVHLYCIVPRGRVPNAALEGVDGRQVHAIDAGPDLACWVSHHATPPQAVAPALRQHAAVAMAAMDYDATPVPIRFGQWLDHEDAAAARVLEERERWLALLAAFAGHAEYGVRIALPELVEPARDVHPGRTAAGREYMAALARRQSHAARRREEAGRLVEWIAAQVGALVTDTRVDPVQASLGVAHLVAWRHADAYRSLLREVCVRRTDLRIATSGPWPPFSFVT